MQILNKDFDISLLKLYFPVFHGFISHFKESVVTATMHGNSLSSSLAVQYVGSKTWLFVPREIFLAEDGFQGISNAVFSVPRAVPSKHMSLFAYTSRPGDLLFFQESYAHVVFTHAGPNILVNYRKSNAGNFFRQPLIFLHTLLNRALYMDRSITDQNKVKPSKIQHDYMKKQNEILCEEGITSSDAELLDLLLSVADSSQ